MKVRQAVFDELNGLIDIESGLLVNIDDHRTLAVEPCRLADALGSFHGFAEIGNSDGCTVPIRDDD